MGPLNDKQIKFCNEYLVDFHGTNAAIRAGYTKKTADVQASRLLRNAKISEYLGKAREKVEAKFEISRDRVMKEYAAIAFSDVRKLFTVDGALQQVNMIEDDIAPAISSTEVQELRSGEMIIGQTTKVKLWDKKGALDSICKMLGYNEPEELDLKNSDGSLKPKEPMTDSQFRELLTALRSKKK